MSLVGAQGDPCTASIFWSIVRPHLLYSASRPVPLTKYISYITESHHSRLVPLKCLPKRRNLTSAKAFATLFLYISSPTRTGELNSHQHQSPTRVKGTHTTGYCPVPRRDRLRHYHQLSAMQPSVQYLTAWLRWTRALFAVLGSYPLRDEDA
jgi:hypothetical protein